MRKIQPKLSGADVFGLLHDAGAIDQCSVRAKVFDQQKPDVGVRAQLLLDYTAPVFEAASTGCVVLAECVFDGLTVGTYQSIVGRVLDELLRGSNRPLDRAIVDAAELKVFAQLIEEPTARLARLNERYLPLVDQVPGGDRLISRLPAVPAYGPETAMVTPRYASGARAHFHRTPALTPEEFAAALQPEMTPFTAEDIQVCLRERLYAVTSEDPGPPM